MVALNAAMSTNSRPLPHNLFAPISVHHPQATLPHWGNVDTGSMVNIIYREVLQAFPYLQEYLQPFEHSVQGIGGKRVRVVGKLVNVPLSLGLMVGEKPCSYATFYVLAAPGYHVLLGLTFLN